MKERILNTLLALSIIGLLVIGLQEKSKEINVNCEFCGEVFNNEQTQLKEMCDICFGWNEHKASLTENGIQVDFSNGEGYYFQGKNR